jgi:cytochrome c oxidase subunit 1
LFWFPIIFLTSINEKLLKSQFLIIFIGVNLTFFPQHFLGLNGIPRRYSEYPDFFYIFNIISSLGSIISSISSILLLFLMWESFRTNRFIINIDFQNSIPDFINEIMPNPHTFELSSYILK